MLPFFVIFILFSQPTRLASYEQVHFQMARAVVEEKVIYKPGSDLDQVEKVWRSLSRVYKKYALKKVNCKSANMTFMDIAKCDLKQSAQAYSASARGTKNALTKLCNLSSHSQLLNFQRQPKPRKKRGIIIGLIVGLIVGGSVAAGGSYALYEGLKDGSSSTSSLSTNDDGINQVSHAVELAIKTLNEINSQTMNFTKHAFKLRITTQQMEREMRILDKMTLKLNKLFLLDQTTIRQLSSATVLDLQWPTKNTNTSTIERLMNKPEGISTGVIKDFLEQSFPYDRDALTQVAITRYGSRSCKDAEIHFDIKINVPDKRTWKKVGPETYLAR